MRLLTVAVVCISFASTSTARTWEVNADGTGDAPNLYAAMDSTVSGDIVLVGPGYYSLPNRLLVPSGVSLVGMNGAAETHLEALANEVLTSGISLHGEMEGIHLYGVSNLSILSLHGAEVQACIVEIIEGGGGLPSTMAVYAPSQVTRSLFVNGEIEIFSIVSFSHNIIGADISSPTPCTCYSFLSNDVYGHVGPNITITTQDLNFFLDPQFCGIAGSGNYFLKSTSPCLPENNPYGVPLSVGPLGVGCGAVSVQQTTWGAVKALYMDRR